MKATFKNITLVNGKFNIEYLECTILEFGNNCGIRILVNGVERWTEKSNVIIK